MGDTLKESELLQPLTTDNFLEIIYINHTRLFPNVYVKSSNLQPNTNSKTSHLVIS